MKLAAKSSAGCHEAGARRAAKSTAMCWRWRCARVMPAKISHPNRMNPTSSVQRNEALKT